MCTTLDVEKTGRRIRDICNEQGVTVDDIACELGVSVQAIYSWFSAKRIPSIDHLIES